MWFAVHLCRQGTITLEQMVEAFERHFTSRPPIGKMVVESRIMSMKQVFDVLAIQADAHRPFGEIAVELGYMTDDQLARLLLEQARRATPVVDILLDMGAASQESLREGLAKVPSGDGSSVPRPHCLKDVRESVE